MQLYQKIITTDTPSGPVTSQEPQQQHHRLNRFDSSSRKIYRNSENSHERQNAIALEEPHREGRARCGGGMDWGIWVKVFPCLGSLITTHARLVPFRFSARTDPKSHYLCSPLRDGDAANGYAASISIYVCTCVYTYIYKA